MPRKPFDVAVREVVERDPRFRPEAYAFLRDALDFTMKRRNRPPRDGGGEGEEAVDLGDDAVGRGETHVSGEELLDGFREYALREFGPMTMAVLEDWGITESGQVGEMVFNLIDAGIFGKSDEDSPEDFRDVLDFDQAFVQPFRPVSLRQPGGGGTSRSLRPGSDVKPESRENS